MDYAVQLLVDADNANDEMLRLLAEFTEMPDHIKLVYLSKLMYKGECWGYSHDKAKAREDFQKILSTLPVELVSLQSINMTYFLEAIASPAHKSVTH